MLEYGGLHIVIVVHPYAHLCSLDSVWLLPLWVCIVLSQTLTAVCYLGSDLIPQLSNV